MSISVESTMGDDDWERFLLDLFKFVPCQGGAWKRISNTRQVARKIIRPCLVTCQWAFEQKGCAFVAEFLQLPKLFLLGAGGFLIMTKCFVSFVRRGRGALSVIEVEFPSCTRLDVSVDLFHTSLGMENHFWSRATPSCGYSIWSTPMHHHWRRGGRTSAGHSSLLGRQ